MNYEEDENEDYEGRGGGEGGLRSRMTRMICNDDAMKRHPRPP